MKTVEKFLNWIVIGLILILGTLLYFDSKKQSEAHLSSLAKPQIDVDSKVNEYMQELQRKKHTEELYSIHRMQRNAQIEAQALRGIDETDPRTVPVERQIWKDPDNEAARAETQMDVIYRRIYDEELAKRESEEEKKRYAAEFIENARQSGFHVQLSMDLEIISVKPIHNPDGHYDSLDLKKDSQ